MPSPAMLVREPNGPEYRQYKACQDQLFAVVASKDDHNAVYMVVKAPAPARPIVFDEDEEGDCGWCGGGGGGRQQEGYDPPPLKTPPRSSRLGYVLLRARAYRHCRCPSTHSVRMAGESTKGIGFVQAMAEIGKEEGIKGYWKGNLPQVIRIIPYSAVQLFSYEVYKVTYPLDVLRLRLAVQSGHSTMSQVALNMLREEGLASFYGGLGPSLIGIAPYIAVNFCVFDLMKKSVPEKYKSRPETSLATALLSATFATLMCYPLDTVRRQMQMKGTPYNTIFDAIPGIVERDGLVGLYRGFVPNALKNLPNSSIKLTAFDTMKILISTGQKELEKIMQENQEKTS
ncbi:hypothetical protein TRIUR3_25274 [Triticum urartu]|uniref:Uncharacterized protein n=2 Tax=Triticum TaxID=4564 RepID=M7Z3V5_TRIUA|nr:hypothetical protein TRIUR3_25274 [Triticum urartu]